MFIDARQRGTMIDRGHRELPIKADYVGNYALRITWSDGHDTGIYAFRFLRELLELALERGPEPGGPHVRES